MFAISIHWMSYALTCSQRNQELFKHKHLWISLGVLYYLKSASLTGISFTVKNPLRHEGHSGACL